MSNFVRTGTGVLYGNLTTITGILINGWVLSILWAWFIIPIFGIHALTFAQALGLCTIVNLLANRRIENFEKTAPPTAFETRVAIFYVLFNAMIFLLIGGIVHMVM